MKHRLFLLLAAASLAFVGCEKEITPLPGCFTISKTQQVKLAPGNLQVTYTLDTATGNKQYVYTFAGNQWDFLGVGSTGPNIAFDLFGWGTGDCPDKNSKSDADYGSFVDWGNNTIIGTDGKPTTGWRTLTYEEWNYIINERPNAAKLRCAATINNNHGMLLLPDAWSLGEIRHAFHPNFLDTVFVLNTSNNNDWEKFEAAGAIFLPAAGVRDDGAIVGQNNIGRYWTSTPDLLNVAFFFGFMNQYEYRVPYRHLGFSVRLAKDQ